jgi:hypothetical protein
LDGYLAEKYAGILTEEDVGNLFDSLVKKLVNNRSEAARRCGLTGKATYDWERATYVKLATKKKVLEASLEEDFIETVDYLLGRNSDRSVDLLRAVLSMLYADAIEAVSRAGFEPVFQKFERIRARYQGFIRDNVRDEVEDMIHALRNRASELGVAAAEKSVDELSPRELIDGLQILGHIYLESPQEAEAFAERDLGLPKQALEPMMQTFRDLCTLKRLRATAVDEFPELAKNLVFLTESNVWKESLPAISPKLPTMIEQNHTHLAKGGARIENTTTA